MTDDARFEDAAESPLRLKALDIEDLGVLSSLVQDAVFPITEVRWQPAHRRFSLLVNRFRWEDLESARRAERPVERVQSLLAIDDILQVQSQGIDRRQTDTILSLLSLRFEGGEDGTGHVILSFAGDGAIRLAVETLDVTLRDVTRPYAAPSGKPPRHPE